MSQNPTPSAQTSTAWCADLQIKLMAALDAAWALAENSNDPAVIARARDKAKLCGQMAAEARKVGAMVPAAKGVSPAAVVREVVERVEAEPSVRAPAAQAVAMQAALRKLKRR